MLSFRGTPSKIRDVKIGRVVTSRAPLFSRSDAVLVKADPSIEDFGYSGIIGQTSRHGIFVSPSITGLSNSDLKRLRDGDVVMLHPDGWVNVLWESSLLHNAFLLTKACNCKCLMCPQPPAPTNREDLNIAMRTLTLIDPDYSGEICLTGGEPTLLGDDFIEFLRQCAVKAPRASFIILTNGKRYSDFNFTKRVAELGIKQLMHCVSLHADMDELHDHIVGRDESFTKTQKGLHNLAKLRQNIEIRCVVNRLNADRLPQIAWHIYRNYPFADHVTFMALEMTGMAIENLTDIWVDPYAYRDALEEAVRCLHRANLQVSVYNHPLCLVSAWTRPFARQSISAWKNTYQPHCSECSAKDVCCGFFTTSGDRLSKHIRPL